MDSNGVPLRPTGSDGGTVIPGDDASTGPSGVDAAGAEAIRASGGGRRPPRCLILISVVVIGVLVIGSLGLLVNEDEAAAVAALAIAREMGVSIPRDLSVVGWDDSLLCELAARPSCQALKYLLLEAS